MSTAHTLPQYSVVIRTLGTAGEKYQELLNSIVAQTHKPQDILVYIAEGYEIPKETCGLEKYIYVPKGMVEQRALDYKDVNTEWILFLDDDLRIPMGGVEKLFTLLRDYQADAISPDLFEHAKISWLSKLKNMLFLLEIPRFWSRTKGYTVTSFGTFCYNPYEDTLVAQSNTNAGPAFLCRKKDFLEIHFEEDCWLDESPYAIPEDMVMFYKMHLHGFKILTQYHSDWIHLDAGSSMGNLNKRKKWLYSVVRNYRIYRSMYIYPNLKWWRKPITYTIVAYWYLILLLRTLFWSVKEFDKDYLMMYRKGYQSAHEFLQGR